MSLYGEEAMDSFFPDVPQTLFTGIFSSKRWGLAELAEAQASH